MANHLNDDNLARVNGNNDGQWGKIAQFSRSRALRVRDHSAEVIKQDTRGRWRSFFSSVFRVYEIFFHIFPHSEWIWRKTHRKNFSANLYKLIFSNPPRWPPLRLWTMFAWSCVSFKRFQFPELNSCEFPS